MTTAEARGLPRPAGRAIVAGGVCVGVVAGLCVVRAAAAGRGALGGDGLGSAQHALRRAGAQHSRIKCHGYITRMFWCDLTSIMKYLQAAKSCKSSVNDK